MTTLADLVSKMNGQVSTNQWDIVCSYTVTQLNQFLQTQYDADKLAKKVSFSIERPNPFVPTESFIISYDIQFASPHLSFISGLSGFATLTMPIKSGSSYSTTLKGATQPIKPVSIPDGKYSVQAVVPLAAIKGDTGEIKEQGNVIEFSDGVVHDWHVIIHFKDEKGTSYKILPEPDPQDQDVLVTYFLPKLKEYFQTEINEIDYALSTVNNSQPPSGSSVFTPKSFAFASTGDGDSSVLSLYIQTSESNNPPGNPSPSFQPGDCQVSPIPESYTASIILSYNLITKAFSKQLENSGFINCRYRVPSTGTGGILFTVDSNKQFLYPQTDDPGNGFLDQHFNSSGFNKPLENLNIQFQDGSCIISLKDESVHITWSQGNNDGDHGFDHNGSTEVDINLPEKTYRLVVDQETFGVPSINLQSSDFTTPLKADPDPETNRTKRVFDHWSTDIPYQFKNLKVVIDPISINLPNFYFFKDTNLLAPGQHIIEVDTNAGVFTPHDFLIVGQVAKQ